MNKKFILAVVVIFVISMLLGFITHAWALADEYAATGLYRSLEVVFGFLHMRPRTIARRASEGHE